MLLYVEALPRYKAANKFIQRCNVVWNSAALE